MPAALIVEDDPDHSLALCRFFQGWGWEVAAANDAVSAVAAAALVRFDLVTLDLMMSPDPGYAVFAALRAAGYHGPIVAVTALEPPEAVSATRGLPFAAVFSKAQIADDGLKAYAGLLAHPVSLPPAASPSVP